MAAEVFKDLVMDTTSTTGTGSVTLSGTPPTGYRPWSDVGNGATAFYRIYAVDVDGNPTGDFEIGSGTYTTIGPTLSRTTVFQNSLGTTALINFAAGTKRVILIIPASQVVASAIANVFTAGPQTLRAGADATIPLLVEGHSATQSAKLLQVRRSTGGAIRFEVDPTGFVMIDDGFGGSVIKDSSGNTIFRGIRSTSWADSQTATFFQVGSSAGNSVLTTATASSAGRFMIDTQSLQVSSRGHASVPIPAGTRVMLELYRYSADTNAAGLTMVVDNESSGTPAAGFGTETRYRLHSSTTTRQEAASLQVTWSDATHATRKARLTWSVYDTAAREGFRIDTDGSGANLSLFGAGSYGSGRGVVFVPDAAVVPAGNPSGGGLLYAEGGVLKWRRSSGDVNALADGLTHQQVMARAAFGGCF